MPFLGLIEKNFASNILRSLLVSESLRFSWKCFSYALQFIPMGVFAYLFCILLVMIQADTSLQASVGRLFTQYVEINPTLFTFCAYLSNFTLSKDQGWCHLDLMSGKNQFWFQVESIMLSIISMLSGPNDESPANVEAAVSFFLLISYDLIRFTLPL